MNSELTPAYISPEPGETTGWAKFDTHGQILGWGQFTQADQNQWLTENITSSIKGVIVEDYKNYAWQKQKRWSRNQTSKNIGAIEMICSLREVPLYLQPANIKKIGYKWAGLIEAPSNHSISHQFDAVAHGTYWLRVNGILIPSTPED